MMIVSSVYQTQINRTIIQRYTTIISPLGLYLRIGRERP